MRLILFGLVLALVFAVGAPLFDAGPLSAGSDDTAQASKQSTADRSGGLKGHPVTQGQSGR